MLRILLRAPLFGALLGLTTTVLGAEQGKLPPGTLVLRLSPAALAGVQQPEFKTEQEVEDLVLETKIKGVAKTSGKCRFESSGQNGGDQLLNVVISGTSITTSEGRNGPAIIRSTTTTNFVAETPLAFDRKTGFSAGETSVEAESKTITNDIRSTQGGIAGAVVKKLAAKKIAASKDEAQAIARELAIKRIRNEIQAELERRLGRLNNSYKHMSPVLTALSKESQEAVSILAGEAGLTVVVAKREHARDAVAVQLPTLKALAELWLPAEDAIKPELESRGDFDKYAVSVNPSEKLPAPILDRYEHWWIVRLPVAKSKTSN